MAISYFDRIPSTLKENVILTGVCATTVLGIAWTVNDFYAWKAFGTGGTPPTWAGYWRMTKIRFFHTISSNNLHDPSPLSTEGPAYLTTPLPKRKGSKPTIQARTMPQRQVPESITPSTRSKLQSLAKDLASSHPDILESKLSHTEGESTDGLYARRDCESLNPIARNKILDHEIAHAHPADNSLHIWLSERDARTVIEAGWGMRFPLTFVEKGWTMVFAPRDDKDMEVVEQIVKAGVAFIAGVEI
ncbi:hypothetical protein EJ08DRAFT_629430 [Tothia fuscella]|uniref:Luciferase domain-containing protein n=1 Tax=Tothia fuscella TaxID=1048955 RepID=A0A9P4U1Q4_9PEZI|nr:hypothetical protein EJ08DRAFT_629430 [Tothia fuscella]